MEMPGATRCEPMKPQRAVVGRMLFVPRSHDANGFGLRNAGSGEYCQLATVSALTEMMPSTAGLRVRSRVMRPRTVESSVKTLMLDSSKDCDGVPGNWLKVHGTVLMAVMSFK